MNNNLIPCENTFNYLATFYPEKLAEWIRSDTLSPGFLTHALEYLGDTKLKNVVSIIEPFLTHESPLVREGAVLGLQNHLNEALRNFIHELSINDPNGGVRFTATDILTNKLVYEA